VPSPSPFLRRSSSLRAQGTFSRSSSASRSATVGGISAQLQCGVSSHTLMCELLRMAPVSISVLFEGLPNIVHSAPVMSMPADKVQAMSLFTIRASRDWAAKCQMKLLPRRSPWG